MAISPSAGPHAGASPQAGSDSAGTAAMSHSLEARPQLDSGSPHPSRAAAAARPSANWPASRMDRRVRRSRRAIFEAFDRLITTMPLEAITVSAIAREADVDRKTFYQHFGTVDGLLDAIAESVVAELLDDVERIMRQRADAEGDVSPTRAFFSALAERLGRDQALSEGYCEHVPSELLLEHLARPLTREAVNRGLVLTAPSEWLDALLAFGLGGILSLYRWWLTSDRTMSLSDLMDFAGQLVEDGVATYLR